MLRFCQGHQWMLGAVGIPAEKGREKVVILRHMNLPVHPKVLSIHIGRNLLGQQGVVECRIKYLLLIFASAGYHDFLKLSVPDVSGL